MSRYLDEMRNDGAPAIKEIASGTRVSRKERTCCICRKVIRPGERYAFNVYTADGQFERIEHHPGALCIDD